MKALEPRLPLIALPHAWEGDTMQIVHPVCCGLDVHQAMLTVCETTSDHLSPQCGVLALLCLVTRLHKICAA
jgi:hypothetical protein